MLNYKQMTEDELIDSVRDHDLWWMYTKEDMIKSLEDLRDNELKVDSDDPDFRKFCIASDIREYQITETFNVGGLTVGILGSEHKGPEIFEPDKGVIKTRGSYVIYKDTPDHWVYEKSYSIREDIEELARQLDLIDKAQCEQASVTFPTGELVFSNFFCEDKDNGLDILPKDIRHTKKYSINYGVGRQNTMTWLAENRGIAYGQLSNTSCNVFKVNDDKLVITDAYATCEVEEDGEVFEIDHPIPDGWQFVGTISCGVWRFEAIDKANMEAHNFDLEEYKKEKKYMDFCETTVNPGKWDLKCYYQYMGDEKLTEKFGYPVWATLERIKE